MPGQAGAGPEAGPEAGPGPCPERSVAGQSFCASARGGEVTNAFCHGDRFGHVLLTPGLLSATADLTCEVIVRLVNTHAARHGALPPVLRVQLDGASTNKNHLCLALLAQYVQTGLFDHAVLQCLVEHHAHESPPSPVAGWVGQPLFWWFANLVKGHGLGVRFVASRGWGVPTTDDRFLQGARRTSRAATGAQPGCLASARRV